MITKEQAIDILERFDFFEGQRAGRELWSEKPVDVQDEDIKNFSEDIAFLKEFINRQKAEIKQKDTEIDILIRKKETLKDELAEKQAEIEELKKYKHDYYVLQSITRKEFAERLKEKSHISLNENWKGSPKLVVTTEDIDHLVKEMTEGGAE